MFLVSRFSYKTLILILLFLLIPIVLFLRISQKGKQVSAEWFNDSWNYRQRVDISNSSGSDLTDFQVSIDIGTSALIAAGKMQSDCDDIRITDQNGNLLPYWIETNGINTCNQSSTKIWVKTPSLPTSGAPVYVYYGNSTASDVTNGNDVFEFFDDFNGSNIDTTKWTVSGTMLSLTGGRIRAERADGTGSMYANSTYSRPFVLDMDFYPTQYPSGWEGTYHGTIAFGTFNSSNQNEHTWVPYGGGGNSYCGLCDDGGCYHGTYVNPLRVGDTLYNISMKIQPTVAGPQGVMSYTNSPNDGIGSSVSNTVYTAATTGDDPLKIGIKDYGGNTSDDFEWDNWRIRKYASTEPTTTPQSEEVGGGPIAYWKFDEGIGTSAFDSTSNQINFRFGTGDSSPSWTTEDQCVSGKCIYFDGTSQELYGGNPEIANVDPGEVRTFSAWFKASPTSNNQTIFWKEGSCIGFSSYIETDGDFNATFRTGTGCTDYTTYSLVISDTDYNDNKWHFQTFIIDRPNEKLTIYIDGVKKGERAIDNTGQANMGYLKMGNLWNNTWPLKGFIDEAKIYIYARTADQIKADYASGLAGMGTSSDSTVNIGGASAKSLSDGLVGYWKFDQASGNFSDYSGNNNTGFVSGSSNYDSGKFGNSFRAGTVGTNLTYNPSVETNVSGWQCWHNSGTGACGQSSDTAAFGTSSWKSTMTTDGNQGNQIGSASVSGSTEYSVSAWVNITSWGGTNFALYMREYYPTGNGQCGNTMYTASGVTNGWIRITGTCTTRADTTNLSVSYYLNNTSQIVYTDGVQIEQASSSTSYIDGSLGAGYAWTSTPHASTSTRTASSASVANSSSLDITSKTITLNTWVKPTTYPSTYSVIFQKAGYTSGYRLMLNSAGKIYAGIGETGGGVLTSTSSIPLNSWTQVSMTYDGQNIKIFFNGVLDNYTAYTNNLVTTSNGIVFGSTEYPFIHGLVDEVRIYNRALNPTEVKQLYEFAPGPVGYWKFEEGVGTTAYDSSGNNIHTTWLGSLGSQWTIGKYGTAGNFNGTDTYLTKTDQDPIDIKTGSSTWSLWFKTNQSTRGIMYRKSDASNTNGVLIDIGGSVAGQVKCAIHFSPSITITSSTSTYNDNKWHHLTCSLDRNNNTLKMYIDGKIGATTIDASTLSAIDLNATSNVYIGQGSGGFFNGQIDEVKIYNYARTQKQILQDMNANNPMSSSKTAIAYWKFDEGRGNIAYNSSSIGNTLNGNITNATWTNTGKFGKALNYNGSTAYTSVSHNSALNFGLNSFSVSYWMNFNPGSTQQRWTLGKGYPYQSSGAGFAIANWTTGDPITPYLYVSDGTGGPTSHSLPFKSMNRGSWYQLTFVVDRNENLVKTFINGVFANQLDISFLGSFDNTDNFLIGTGNGTTNYSDAKIDEVKIYNYALSAEEVKQDYNQGSTFVFGTSNQTIGSTTTSLDYCVPGDTSPCFPPVAEWKFEEGVGTTAYDTSGNNFHGIFGVGSSAPSWNNGKMGTAVYFDGTPGKHVTVSAGSGNSNNFTVQAWVKPTNYTGSGNNNDRNTILHANNKYLQIYSNGKIAVYINGLSSPGYHYSNATVPLNQWSHVAYNYNGSEIRIFINGFLDSSFPATGTPPDGWVNATIGFQDSSYQRQFDGSVDQVQIYNYARTPAQIAWSYNKGAPVGWWKMDECQGTQIADWSGNSNHGTLSIGASGTQTSAGTCTTSGTAWANGKLGKFNASLNFDGSDDYFLISQPKIQTSPNHFTVTGFIKPGNQISRFITPQSTGFDQYFTYVNTSQRLAIHIAETNDTNERDRYSTTNSVPLNTWTHFAVSINDKDIKIYINGKLDSQYTETINISGWSGNWYIGQRGNSTNWFLGQLDDLRIYNYALTATQIKTLYNNGSVTFR